jgi:hypothetical protein
MWQVCPICNGTGFNNNSTFSTIPPTCSVCSGMKIISEITGLPPNTGAKIVSASTSVATTNSLLDSGAQIGSTSSASTIDPTEDKINVDATPEKQPEPPVIIDPNWIEKLYSIEKWKKYSQAYEECYLDIILKNIPNPTKHIVEFGAWDGFHLSNTRHFIENGYTALLIDGDNRGNNEVKQHFIHKDNVIDILKQYNTPNVFDLLSFDLDGNDYYILREILKEYKPCAFIAEFNPIFAENQSFAIQYNENHVWNNDDYYGFSFAAGVKLAAEFGYTCIFQNDDLNMYFMRNDIITAPIPKVSYTVRNYHPHNQTSIWLNV